MADSFRCSGCETVFRIPSKRNGQNRKKGHVKHLWCWRCKTVTAHVLLR